MIEHKLVVRKPVWEIEFLPGITLQCKAKPSIWTRIGVWVWFGLRGRMINDCLAK